MIRITKWLVGCVFFKCNCFAEEEVVVKADLVSHGYVLAVEDEVVEEEPPVFARAIRELTKRVVEFFTGWI